MYEPIFGQSIDNNNGSISLIADKIYNKVIHSQFHIKADQSNFDIFLPNWKELSESPAEELDNLVAQSIGLDPAFAVYKWVMDYVIPCLEKREDKEDVEKCKKLKEFIRRIGVALKNIAPFGELKPISADDSDSPPRFNRLEFMAFSEKIGWPVPLELQPDKEGDVQGKSGKQSTESELKGFSGSECSDMSTNTPPKYLDSVHPMFSVELSIAIQAWNAVLECSPSKPKTGSRKQLIEKWLRINHSTLTSEASNRITTMLNPDKNGGAPPFN